MNSRLEEIKDNVFKQIDFALSQNETCGEIEIGIGDFNYMLELIDKLSKNNTKG